jgi:hypothetical protein
MIASGLVVFACIPVVAILVYINLILNHGSVNTTTSTTASITINSLNPCKFAIDKMSLSQR